MKNLRQFIWKISNIWPLSRKSWKKAFLFSQENETYNLRSCNHLARKNIETRKYGIESVSNLGAKIWDFFQEKRKIVLPSPFPKIKLENGPLKNVYASFANKNKIKHIDYIWFFSDMLYFEFKFKSLWDSRGMKSFHISKNWLSLICTKMILRRCIYKRKFTFSFIFYNN